MEWTPWNRPPAERGDWRTGRLASVFERASDPGLTRPDPTLIQEVEGLHHGVIRRQRLSFALLLGASAVLLGLGWASGAIREHPVLAQIALAVLVLTQARTYGSLLFRRRIPIEKATGLVLGDFTAAQVSDLVKEVQDSFCTQHGARRSPNVFLIESREANARVVDTPLLGFVPPFNAVYIHSCLLSLLDADELRAVLAHELAHFHCYMNPFSRHHGLEYSFTALLTFWLGSAMIDFLKPRSLPEDVVELLIPLGVLLAVQIVYHSPSVYAWLARGGEHESELLSDSMAARLFGSLPMINALLKMSLRNDLYRVLLEEVALVLGTNTGENLQGLLVEGEKAIPDRTLGPEAVRGLIRARLAPLRGPKSVFLEEFDDCREIEQRRPLVREIRRAARAARRLRKLDWLAFDKRVRDSRLDAEECAELVRALLRHRDASIEIYEEGGDPVSDEDRDAHPIVRDRILFLASTLPLKG